MSWSFSVLVAALIQSSSSLRHSSCNSRARLQLAPAAATGGDLNNDDSMFWSDKENYILSGEVALKGKFVEIDKKRAREIAMKKQMDAEIALEQEILSKEVITVNKVVNIDVGKDVGKETSKTIDEKSVQQKKNKVIPFFDVSTIGVQGRWLEKSGNFILFPVDSEGEELVQPAGVIHFLGGAFVGAAPHITYRYLLTL